MDKTLFNGPNSLATSPIRETTESMAQRGDAAAQFSLGLKFASGSGALQDYGQAAHWYLKAADQSHSLAQFNLGIMYANGQGMPRDPARSLVWIQRAADLGDAGAQYNLGVTHHRASLSGLPEDAAGSRIDAYKWLRLAAAQGYQGSETACDVVNLHMTREDVAEGGRRIAAFNAGKADQPQGQHLQSSRFNLS
jgi:TPR repeat protein